MKKGKDRSAKAFFSVEENAREMVKLAFSELGIDAEPKDVKVEDPVVSYLDDNLSLEKLVEDHRIQPKQTTYFNVCVISPLVHKNEGSRINCPHE